MTVVTYKVGGSVYNPKLGGGAHAFVHASAVRFYRGGRDSCVLCSIPSRSLSVTRPSFAVVVALCMPVRGRMRSGVYLGLLVPQTFSVLIEVGSALIRGSEVEVSR